MGADHLEIEHKFIVPADFDRAAFAAAAQLRGPLRTAAVEVEDSYFVVAANPAVIFRHRCDRERQELTVKTRGGDCEVRLEVNLRLDQQRGNQRAAVAAFLQPFGVRWQGTLRKDLVVFEFADCEIVHYRAESPDGRVACVEFEAVGQPDIATARAVLARYEAALGFADRERSQVSLFDLLLAPRMRAEVGA